VERVQRWELEDGDTRNGTKIRYNVRYRAVYSNSLPCRRPALALPLPFLALPLIYKTLALPFPAMKIYLPYPTKAMVAVGQGRGGQG
jgi:hypothetical protein